MNRRGFLFGGATALLAAPAIVRVASLMSVSVLKEPYIVRRWLPYAASSLRVGYASNIWWKAVMVEDPDWLQVARAGDAQFISA